MIINYLALITALAVSSVSAYYSIIGLTAIFSSQFWPIVIMGSVLEIGKLVTASWLYRNWNITPLLIKLYLTISVFLLMFITSMGIFGFLSKAHIEQNITIDSGVTDNVRIIISKIDTEKRFIEDLDKQIQQIDTALSKMTDRGQAATALKAADQQRKTRDSLVKRKDEHVKNISAFNEQRINFETQIRKLEAEVGPIKYISELIYQNAEKNEVEKSVRFVIIILVLVFDPLAIVLLIASNIGLRKKEQLININNPGILEIDNKVLGVK
jgi:hypothetical protein